MSKLIAVVLLAVFIMSNDSERKYSYEDSYEDIATEYNAPQRKKNTEEGPGKIHISGKWIHQNKYVISNEAGLSEQDLEERLNGVSSSYIECLQEKISIEEAAIFDFPLQGWLYDTFAHSARMRSFFDTGVSEHWVLPNVYCNSNNVLSAVSWMKSHKEMSFMKNKEMHARFRNSTPPLYDKKLLEDKSREGVYCGWQGWLYDSEHGKYQYYFDTAEDESFTFINVYCRDKRARFFAKSVGGNLARKEERGLLFPFGYRDRYAKMAESSTDDDYPSIGCNWTGWLFSDVTKKEWNDGDKKRQAYEKYFAVDKTWVNGRVLNPFCSRSEGMDSGVMTALKVYCFYHIGEREITDRCDDLKPEQP